MIKADIKSGMIACEGTPPEMLTELTLLIKVLRKHVKDELGEETANYAIVKAGQIAFDDPSNISTGINKILDEMEDALVCGVKRDMNIS